MALYGSRQRYAIERPDMSSRENLLSRALYIAEIPGRELAAMPGPRYDPFPPRFGYDDDQPGIDDVLATGVANPDFRFWASGLDNFTATARPSGSDVH